MTKTLAEVQEELNLFTNRLKELFPDEENLSANQLLEKLIHEKDALEMALFEKRLENIQDFDKYRENLKAVESDLTEQIQDDQQEIKELEKRVSLLTKERIRLQRDKSLAELKLSNLELGESNNNFWLDDDIISLMVPFLFVALGSMVFIYSLPKKNN